MNAMMHNETNHNGNFAAPYRGPINAVHICLRKYIDFNGRASRSEFWWFVLFLVLGTIIVESLGLHFHKDAECRAASWLYKPNHCTVFFNCTICGLWHLATLLPAYAVVVRRLHDIERSGWWVLLSVPSEVVGLIPAASDSIWSNVSTIVGLPLLVMMCLRGKPNDASIGTVEKLLQWFVARWENRIDRIWLSGVLVVATLTWKLLGMQYIALFLIGYFYVFVLIARKHIAACYLRDALAQKRYELSVKRHKRKTYLSGIVGVFAFLAVDSLASITYKLNLPPEMIFSAISCAAFGWVFLVYYRLPFFAYAQNDSPSRNSAKKFGGGYARFFVSATTIAIAASLWVCALVYMLNVFAAEFSDYRKVVTYPLIALVLLYITALLVSPAARD